MVHPRTPRKDGVGSRRRLTWPRSVTRWSDGLTGPQDRSALCERIAWAVGFVGVSVCGGKLWRVEAWPDREIGIRVCEGVIC